ncbi:MAG TPA: lysophospholipid acyltransferase family protein [Candidatus Avamphibacillus sp.]|nr:lysophospholipid acyltransferase family protein [Candidatus Avamphibacillus sp.]
MFFTIMIYVYATILVIGSLFKLPKAKKRFNSREIKNEIDKMIFSTPRNVSRKVIKRTGSKVYVKGQENLPEGTALYVSNHQGLFDILVLLGYLGKPVGFIAKKEIQRIPIINKWMKLIYCVFMDRKDRRQSVQAIREGIRNLKAGYSMVVFPEGTRSRGSKLNTFKAGSLKLATRAKVKIVPITIHGTSQMLEENDGKVKPSKVTLTIEKPILPEEYESMKNEELASILKDRIEKNLLIDSNITEEGKEPAKPSTV